MPTRYHLTLADPEIRSYEPEILEGLLRFNSLHTPHVLDGGYKRKPLEVVLLDEAGGCVGGVIAGTRWEWLEVSLVWLAEEARGQDWGTRLMEAAEAEAHRRGCRWSRLNTFSFQARGFYEKLGYRVVGQVDDYPPGCTDYLLRKEL